MMAHGTKTDEKVVYVGDSRVKKGKGWQTPPDYTAYPGKSEAFIPNFLLKEWMVGCVVLVAFLVWVISEPAPLGYPADPTNSSFIPMPDWYFLFLYQFLKYPYVSQEYVLLGTMGVPGIMFGALLLAPFLDTGKERRFYRRPIASSIMLLSIAAVSYLTIVSWDHYQETLEKNGVTPEHHLRIEEVKGILESGGERPDFVKRPGAEPEASLLNPTDPAFSLAQEAQCMACHGNQLEGQAGNPSLVRVGDRLTKDQIVVILTDGRGNMPSQTDKLSADEIDQLSTWLASQQTPEED